MLADDPATHTHPAVTGAGGVIALDSADGHYLLGAIFTPHNAALGPCTPLSRQPCS